MYSDSILEIKVDKENRSIIVEDLVSSRLDKLNQKTTFDLVYNDKVRSYIDRYLSFDNRLISKMHGLSLYYFPIFEAQLRQYDLPLELKYLAIVESALDPYAQSQSGATGLWQFMYPTGKQYGLEVTSYIDERKNPLKATIAACKYFKVLYSMFGDWNLVLAAYNGGPGYIKNKIKTYGTNDFWKLYPNLRQETRNFVPKFIAINYAMNFSAEHNIDVEIPKINFKKTDFISIKNQVEIKTLVALLCISPEKIQYLNPSFLKDIYPKGSKIVLPSNIINDFRLNKEANYNFIKEVKKKNILIDEERLLYKVRKGDYLGKISQLHNVSIDEIMQWNSLNSTNLDIGDNLIIYVPIINLQESNQLSFNKNKYIIRKGDTLWGIAKKHKGISVAAIKSLNNLESDRLQPGMTIILPELL
tara:strand:- start:430 stop:1677 length:1248 start_codon:yes stop_codon:yes gene_type:complete